MQQLLPQPQLHIDLPERYAPAESRRLGEGCLGHTPSTLALLLLALVGLLFLGGPVCLTYRHPKIATPLLVASTFATVLIGTVALIAAR
ncbi:hypothetical protein [Streptomyces flavidovirens]|uniref:Integral membrane protein n=1 Tax=Streptomyces flavidovirens TaxID=67298 RepID=A0ABW6RRI5_9ACTN